MEIKLKGMVRYPHLFTPSAPRGTVNRRYGVQILIAKNDPQLVAVQSAVLNAEQTLFPAGMPPGSHSCLKDLALEPGSNVALHNYMSLSLTSSEDQGQPPVVDGNRQPIIDPGTIKPGDVVWVIGATQGYNQVSKGVKCYLNATMTTDEPGTLPIDVLSSRPTVDQMFANMPAPAPVAAPVAAAVAAPVAAAPQFAAPIAAAAPQFAAPIAAEQHVMLPAALGVTYETMIAAGWTNEALIAHQMMQG